MELAQTSKIPTPVTITIFNILFGLGIIVVPVMALFSAMFADTQAGVDFASVVAPLGFYYPFVAIASIIMSRRTRSYWWAFSPLIFIIFYPIFAEINPYFFGAPVNFVFKMVFGSKLF
jgi:hypothetical protein